MTRISKYHSIVAVVPVYDQYGGNASRIYYKNGETREVRYRVRTVMQKIAGYYGIDLDAQLHYYGNLLGCTQSAPLPIHPRLIYVPIKMRQPRAPNDKTVGYISYTAIREIVAAKPTPDFPFKSILLLKNGIELPCLFSPAVVDQRIRNGNKAGKHHRRKLGYDSVSAQKDRNSKEALIRIVLKLITAIHRAILNVLFDNDEDSDEE